MSETQFKAGDKVTWTHCTSNGRKMGFRTREGKIKTVLNSYAHVVYRGQLEAVPLSELRLYGQPTGVTELFNTLAAECQKGQQ
jgi:hypothetical protein